MTRISLILLLLVLPVLSAIAQDRPCTPAETALIREGVRKAAATVQSISSDFTQEKEMKILEEKIRSKGRFLFKKESKLRWEYTSPFSYTILINGPVITIRDETSTRAFNMQSNKVFAEVNAIILGSVRGTLLLSLIHISEPTRPY
jgi:outer membrane lipoprotein-sorting protein